MTRYNRETAERWTLEELAEHMDQAAKGLRAAAAEIYRVRATKTSEALVRAEEAEAEVAELRANLTEERARSAEMGRDAGRIRRALNGSGQNPMYEHAARVFAALKEAAPDHPLVKNKETSP